MCVVTGSTIGVDERDHEDDVSIETSPSSRLPSLHKQSCNLNDEMLGLNCGSHVKPTIQDLHLVISSQVRHQIFP